ncbi:MAG: hypothetical protein HUU10_01465 [Bacteroidetes bacterium]|nr:hypothetical protein [Bacteroidota bacterium]
MQNPILSLLPLLGAILCFESHAFTSGADSTIRSTKTRYLIELPPDRVDSAIAAETVSGRWDGYKRQVSSHTWVTGGVSVGQSSGTTAFSQLVSKGVRFEWMGPSGTFHLFYHDLKIAERSEIHEQFQIINGATGLTFSDYPFIYFTRLGGGLLGYRAHNKYNQFPNLVLEAGSWYFLDSPMASGLFITVRQLVTEPFYYLEANTGYHLYLGNQVACSFVLAYGKFDQHHVLSVGTLIGFYLPDFSLQW